LHILAYGTAEWIEGRPFATGSGDLFAYALLQKYQELELGLTMAEVLAYKTVEEAIQVASFGLGPPIDIWEITEKGHKKLEPEDIAKLDDVAHTVRQAELQVFQARAPGKTE